MTRVEAPFHETIRSAPMSTTGRRLAMVLIALAAAGGGLWASRGWACPFCAAVSLTFNEEITNSQVAVIATLTKAPDKPAAGAAGGSLDVPKAKFDIVQVLKGKEALGNAASIDVVYFGDNKPGTKFLIMGIDPPNVNWGTPIAITDRGQEYVVKGLELPKEGPDRMAFFQDYLEDSDEMLARDAYDEFAKTPYSGVMALKDRMKHDKLVEWIKSQQVPVSRRRLYLTMLGVCGTKADVPFLEEMIKSKDRQTKGALDALVAAYLTLDGPDGMPLVEDLFLKNKDAEYTDTYAAIMALRFHGTEEKIIPRDRLLQGIRTMLDRPQLADLVIPDLARWEDWSVTDRLVELFKTADEESSWVRVPVINYLRACPLPKAKEQLEELAKLDPETVKRANSFFPLTGATPAAGGEGDKATGTAAPPLADKASDRKDEEKAATAATPPAPATAGAKSESPAAKPASGAIVESKDLVAPPAVPETNLPVYGGLAAAAVLLGCAFWMILKGGQHSAG
jgi:hypothetical protein